MPLKVERGIDRLLTLGRRKCQPTDHEVKQGRPVAPQLDPRHNMEAVAPSVIDEDLLSEVLKDEMTPALRLALPVRSVGGPWIYHWPAGHTAV
jgi:hypothetical protein